MKLAAAGSAANTCGAGAGTGSAGAATGAGGKYWLVGTAGAACCCAASNGGKYWRKCETSALAAAIKAKAKKAKNF